jgi:PAS domain S-box-containing protein
MSNTDLQNNDSSPFIAEILSDDHYYRSIIENNSFYVIKTDLEGRYTYMNPFFCKIFGLNLQDWIGKPSIELIIPEDHQACVNAVELCFTEPGQSHWVILRKPHFNKTLSTQWEFKVVKDHLGHPIEVLCIGHDISSLIIRQQELQALVETTAAQNTKLVNFTYIVSHNIRSHVANIIGIVALNEHGNEEDKLLSWSIIKKSVTGLDATIHNLNDVITIQTNTNLPTKRIQIKDEVNRIIDSIRLLFDKADTMVNYHFDNSVFLQTNPAYLESIILNLLTNSLKYKSPDRALQIDLSFIQEDRYKVLILRDNGIGIDMVKNSEKVFGMYKTFHDNVDAKGMGLFIVKTQIEALSGKIELESELNEYTTLKVYFAETIEKAD